MDKDDIISAIRRTANDGVALGKKKFEKTTNITMYEVYKHWDRWTDAVREAGLEPQGFRGKDYSDEELVVYLVKWTAEKGAYLTDQMIKRRTAHDKDLPGFSTFKNRLGNTSDRALLVIQYCEKSGELDHVAEICRPKVKHTENDNSDCTDSSDTKHGFVYLYLTGEGKYHKIGLTENVPRRIQEHARENRSRYPEEGSFIHAIETDDQRGVEAYWHHRFKSKHHKTSEDGEWYILKPADVRAFKRWKKIF